ncbi:hypothetical protein HPCPY6271_1457 [Helicobacter pylori CPY6271]|nr:hypothetical protein HPCPY1124_0024 [Helicobacter pylori CPY1124]EJB22888.1 hypothetical protein HPCPY6271_1457 [Helicobacter pylori CPY6271]
MIFSSRANLMKRYFDFWHKKPPPYNPLTLTFYRFYARG